MLGIIYVICNLWALNVFLQGHVYTLGTVALHLVMTVHLLRGFSEQEDHFRWCRPRGKMMTGGLFIKVVGGSFESDRGLFTPFEKGLVRSHIVLVNIGARIEPIDLIRKKERLLLGTAINLGMGCKPKVQTAGPALWGTADNDIWKKCFVHARKIVRFSARLWSRATL